MLLLSRGATIDTAQNPVHEPPASTVEGNLACVNPALALLTLRRFSARTRDLRALGASTRSIAASVHRGDIVRVRIGHYALPTAARHPVAALRVGGVAACVSAAERFGLWMPPHVTPHVWLADNASRLRDPPFDRSLPAGSDTHVRHWSYLHRPLEAQRGTVSLLDCLLQVIQCQPRLHAIAILDSAMKARLLTLADRDRLGEFVPEAERGILHLLDAASGSGTESIVRTILRDAGLATRSQVEFVGVGFVDLLVGGRVIVEVDSKEWHGSAEQQVRDYRRDLELTARGFIVVRVSYRQALNDHAGILRAVFAALATARGE